MTSDRAAASSGEHATRPWDIPTRLTLAAAPAALATVVLGVALVIQLLASDPTPGFSAAEGWALIVGAVALLSAGATLAGVVVNARAVSADVHQVTEATRTMARRDLVDLLDALRDPDAEPRTVATPRVGIDRHDEVGELARAFRQLHAALIEVSSRQMEALRKGVSSIFMTLARRNSSLVDRQLALLDELEAREEDPETLGGYYKLDHLATRMRRNAESLLVLAGSESPRVWAKATDITDVVRAAIGEVDEYQRVEVVALEPAKLSGGAVSDVAHLLAELLENAIAFSPPSEVVRVTGLFDVDGYTLTVSDRGVGISESRIAELNRILAQPPALGLSVEPTMGMFVVAKLAHRHGLGVELIRGVPGITATVTVPRDHLEIAERGEPWARDEGYEDEGPVRRAQPRDFEESPTAPAIEVPAAHGATVIDLTDPIFDEPEPARQGTSLTVRRPGATFRDDDSQEPAAGPSERAAGIRAALTAYDRGRKAASAPEGWDFDRDVEERS